MAVTAEAARLTEAHRIAQSRIGIRVVRTMLAAWSLLDPTDLDGSFANWLRIVGPIVDNQRQTSATLAANYVAAFRTFEVGLDTGFTPRLALPLDRRRLATSMLVTGPVSVRNAMTRKTPLGEAMRTAQANSARAAMRLTLEAGRDTIRDTVDADPKAHGWARTTSGKACAFCAMLAGRGPVYGADSAHFHAHDGCSCSAEPVYDRDAAWPTGAKRYRQIWNDAKAKASDGDVLNAFRSALADG